MTKYMTRKRFRVSKDETDRYYGLSPNTSTYKDVIEEEDDDTD